MTLFINSGKLRGTDSGPFDLPEGLPASGAGDAGSGVEAQVLAEPALRFEVELSSSASWNMLPSSGSGRNLACLRPPRRPRARRASPPDPSSDRIQPPSVACTCAEERNGRSGVSTIHTAHCPASLDGRSRKTRALHESRFCDLSRKKRRAPAQAARRSVASQPQRRLVASLKTRVPICLAIVHRWTPTSLNSETIAEEIPSKSRVYQINRHAIHQARKAP